MLFNSGTKSLLSYTRFLAGDPATAVDGTAVPSPLFSDQWVKDTINGAYLRRRDAMRMKDVGHGNKRTYGDVVADQIFYQKPADMIRLIHVEIEGGGLNLSTAAEEDTAVTFTRAQEMTEALRAYHSGELSGVTFSFLHEEHFGIVAPPDTAGTKSMRLSYAASSAELSGDTDEPVIPRHHHELLCYDAAITLRVSRQLPVQDLRIEQLQRHQEFSRSLVDAQEDVEHQIPSPSRQRVSLVTKMGANSPVRG